MWKRKTKGNQQGPESISDGPIVIHIIIDLFLHCWWVEIYIIIEYYAYKMYTGY